VRAAGVTAASGPQRGRGAGAVVHHRRAPGRVTRRRFVTDGGIETDLIERRGVELRDFAAFPLLEDASGRAVLEAYYDDYVEIARASGSSLMLESPTWRANPDWGARLGFDAE